MIRIDRPGSSKFRKALEENTDDACNELRQLVEVFNDRFTLENLGFAKRYVKGEIGIHLHIRVPSARGLDPVYFCAIFERKGIMGGSVMEFDVLSIERNNRPSGATLPNFDLGGIRPEDDGFERGPYYDQKSVLVSDIEQMEGVKTPIPSTVRFQGLDQAPCVIADALYFSLALGREISLIRADRKLGLPIGRPAISLDELPREMIQRGSQVVDCIASNRAKPEWETADYSYSKDPISGLWLVLGDDFIGLASRKASTSDLRLLTCSLAR